MSYVNPNYKEDSAAFEKDVLAIMEKYKSEAQETLSKALPQSAKVMTDLLNSMPMSDEEYRAAQMQFKASAHIMKVGGLEVERVENTGNIFITTEREKKILEAAKL